MACGFTTFCNLPSQTQTNLTQLEEKKSSIGLFKVTHSTGVETRQSIYWSTRRHCFAQFLAKEKSRVNSIYDFQGKTRGVQWGYRHNYYIYEEMIEVSYVVGKGSRKPWA